jgi:hypothetical protein
VIGVTSVLADVTKTRLKYHLLLRFNTVATCLQLVLITWFIYQLDCLTTTVAVAMAQFAGDAPVSHNCICNQ